MILILFISHALAACIGFFIAALMAATKRGEQ